MTNNGKAASVPVMQVSSVNTTSVCPMCIVLASLKATLYKAALLSTIASNNAGLCLMCSLVPRPKGSGTNLV